MKFTTLHTKLLLFMLMLTLGCQPEDDFPELVDPLVIKPELLEGTWTAQKIMQFDREAIDNGFPEEIQRRDVTGLFPFTDYQLTFELDASGRPGTFTVVPGESPNFLSISAGNWALDDYVFATTISLTNPAEVTTSSFRIKLLNKTKILLQLVRNDANDNTEYSYYEYEFTKN